MSKSIYVLVWSTESGDRGVDGYFNRNLTKPEQHAHFKKHHPCDYDVDGSCFIQWKMVELKRTKILPELPEHLQTEPL